MVVLILCGGQGLRIKGHFNETPKPLIKIQGKSLLTYIIDHYKSYGINHFILLVGDNEQEFIEFSKENSCENTSIEVLQTGVDTNTGGRIKKAEHLLNNIDHFFLTYGDGIANINFEKQLKFHKDHGKIATLTAVKPQLPFGLLKFGLNDSVESFIEKPIIDEYINGGFFVLSKKIFSYLKDDSDFEDEILPQLSDQHQLNAYKHSGVWKNMDTYKDFLFLDLNINKLL